MGVSYKKLRMLIAEIGAKGYEIKEATGLSNGFMVKINRDRYVQLDKLILIMEYIEKHTGRRLQFEDVMERTFDDML